jgi:tetratricopeptide (TPR) repeat protein
MKRSASRPQTLKHLPFFEVLANAPEGSDEAKLATAGLLSLRMIDHWVLAGPAIVEPESVSVRSVRQAIMALPPKEPVRESLLTIVNTMQMLRNVDLIPVLPRVFAYAQLLERHHGALALAADAYESVIRLGDPEFDAEITLDSYQRLSSCQRRLGELDAAFETSSALVKLGARRKDKARALRGKIGLAFVTMMRGRLPEADSQFQSIAIEAQRLGLSIEFAQATHNRGVVAFRAGNAAEAAILSHQALKSTTDPVDRDRILSDLAAFLIKLEQYDAAIDALRILEVTAVSEEPRQAARVNLVGVAARTGDRRLFDSAREEIKAESLPVEARINFMIESARGFDSFGDVEQAHELLSDASAEATRLCLERAVSEIEEMREALARPDREQRSVRMPVTRTFSITSEVASDLRRMAAALIAA